jgi:hypothetical protein
VYEIVDVQDVSRPRAKRFVAHVVVSTMDKQKVLEIIKEVTKKIRDDNEEYCTEHTIRKFGDSPAHVVRLYVHVRKENEDSLIAQSMWMDNNAKDVTLPKPLTCNDEIEDIGVAWFDLEGIVW